MPIFSKPYGKTFPLRTITFAIIAFVGFSEVSVFASTQLEEKISGIKFDRDWNTYSAEEMEAYNIHKEYEDKSSDIFALQQAKRGIINGDLELARFFLSKISDRRTKLLKVKKRYLSIIKFIEADYQGSYDLIKGSEFNNVTNYREICLLRIINLVALEDLRTLNEEVGSCQNLTFQFSNNNQFWLTQMAKIKERDEELLKGNLIENFRNALTSTEFTEIWMKMALFLNKEKIVLKYIGQFPPSTFQSKAVRELIGFAYYRDGQPKKALDFIEDIESPNADNIRGNINLEEKKYELAFGHFKLALQKKENSQNALERGIPLSYILSQWDEGIKMLKRIVGINLNIRKKTTLETLFYIRKEDFKKARENLLYLEQKYNKNFPREVNLMDSYVALREGDNQKLELSAGKACQGYDGLNCWLTLQLLHWENIGQTIEREEETLSFKGWSIDSLKEKVEIKPLRESVSIDQRDIEELDDNLVKINPEERSQK